MISPPDRSNITSLETSLDQFQPDSRHDRENEAASKAAAEERAQAQAEAEQERQARQLLAQIEARIGPKPYRGFSSGYTEVRRFLESKAHDPDSISFERCSVAQPLDDGWHTTCAYRGRNAFGALRLHTGHFVIRHGSVIAHEPID